MTIDEFVCLIKTIDPNPIKYRAIGQMDNQYTVYFPYKHESMFCDNEEAESAERIQVDYFTKTDNDPIAAQFLHAFSHSDSISCSYRTDFEDDTRYIHHIFDCVVV